VHLATMGGLWQAVAFGFAGVRASNGRLVVDPRLPPSWNALELGLRFHDEPFRLRIEKRSVEVDSDALALTRVDGHWEVAKR
jgi:kojibiose phosphorylase